MIKTVLFLSLLSFGCEEVRQNASRDGVDELIYVLDSKTGLCFATHHNGHYMMVVANVPCENVRQFLINTKKGK